MARATLEDLLARHGVQEAEYRDGRKSYLCDRCGQRVSAVVVVQGKAGPNMARKERQVCHDCLDRDERPLGRDWRRKE